MSQLSPPPPGPAPAAPLAPPVSGAPQVKQTERPHPLTPFIRGWILFLAILVGFFRDLLPGGQPGNRFDSADPRVVVLFVTLAVLLAAAAGFVSWYFTRFVIDDEELRIETGAVFKTSRKVPFERLQSIDIIQPLAARLFGLAELRLEVGAGDSTIKLRYLGRARASRLRDYLLARAHGEQARVADVAGTPAASVLTDLSVADKPLVTVTPQRLIGGFLLSTEWLATGGITVAALVVAAGYNVVPYALPGLIPLLIGAVGMISRRVVSMFHFTLAESTRGLRVTRGLTNLTSQSVPLNRIQGVRISQPLLWRPTHWFRVDVDILGYGVRDSENNESQATSVLLPVATAAEVAVAVRRVLPGVDLDSIELHPSPARARWVRWFDFWTLRYGWNNRVIVCDHGWLTRSRDIVPHAKTQSVRIEQGPLQRRLRLADVHIDTTRGPVNAVARQLDPVAARTLALTQLDRARSARALERAVPPERAPAGEDAISEETALCQFGLGLDALLGSGGESRVYALDEGRVLRLYRTTHEAADLTIRQLRALYQGWQEVPLGFELPLILDFGEVAGRPYSIDRRFSGVPMSPWLAQARRDERRRVLLGYLDAAVAIPRLPSPIRGFARLVGAGAPQTFGSLMELLQAQLEPALRVSRARLDRDLPDPAGVWRRLMDELGHRVCIPALVHGDFCPPNLYLSRRPDGAPVVSGLGDFSPHTLCADPLLDLTGAIAFLELESYPEAADDAQWLEQQAVSRYGSDISRWVSMYRSYYAFYYSSTYDVDPALYAWCLRQLH